jgi:hypothetical protein
MGGVGGNGGFTICCYLTARDETDDGVGSVVECLGFVCCHRGGAKSTREEKPILEFQFSAGAWDYFTEREERIVRNIPHI